MLTLLGVGELFPHTELMEYVASHYCDADIESVDVCYNIFFLLVGPDTSEINKVRLLQGSGHVTIKVQYSLILPCLCLLLILLQR